MVVSLDWSFHCKVRQFKFSLLTDSNLARFSDCALNMIVILYDTENCIDNHSTLFSYLSQICEHLFRLHVVLQRLSFLVPSVYITFVRTWIRILLNCFSLDNRNQVAIEFPISGSIRLIAFGSSIGNASLSVGNGPIQNTMRAHLLFVLRTWLAKQSHYKELYKKNWLGA